MIAFFRLLDQCTHDLRLTPPRRMRVAFVFSWRGLGFGVIIFTVVFVFEERR